MNAYRSCFSRTCSYPGGEIMDKPELFALKQGVKSEGTKILAREMLKNVYERILIVINTYLDIKPEYAQIVAHWIIGTYIHKEFNTFPRLFINATKGSGKSRLLQILAGLCYNASVMVNLSEAVRFIMPGGISQHLWLRKCII